GADGSRRAAHAPGPELERRGALMDDHAEALARSRQPAHEPRWIDPRGVRPERGGRHPGDVYERLQLAALYFPAEIAALVGAPRATEQAGSLGLGGGDRQRPLVEVAAVDPLLARDPADLVDGRLRLTHRPPDRVGVARLAVGPGARRAVARLELGRG